MSVSELLPCPFCGEAPSPRVLEGSTFRWRILEGCCVNGPEIRHDTLADDQEAAERESTAEAIAAWNRRTPATYQPNINSGETDNATPPAQAAEAVEEPEWKRYTVGKASGSRYAYVLDGERGGTVARYDVMKGDGKRNGWNMAKAHADKLNAAIAAMQAGG